MPKVSIVIPVFNGEKHIERVMQELFYQTEGDIEIIAVDDGSEDESYSLLKQAALKDKRLKVLHVDNCGPGVARNIGMDEARGNYIIFLDIDDHFTDDLVETMYQTAEEAKADITICSALRYDAAFHLVKPFPEALQFRDIPYEKKWFSPEDVNTKLFQITGAFVWNKLFRLPFLKKHHIRFAETYCYEDMAMLLPALACAGKIAVTYKELVQYRMEAGGSLSDNRNQYYKALTWTASEVLRKLESIGKYEKFEQSYLNKMLNVFCQVFRSYTSEEAFLEIYQFVKDKFSEKWEKHADSYYYSLYDREVLKVFLESETAMDFVLQMFHVRHESSQDVFFKYWIFPYDRIEKNSAVVLFGAGDVGRDLYIQVVKTNWCKVVAWVDSAPDKYVHRGFPVENKAIIRECKFDKILVCIKDEKMRRQVCQELERDGIAADKILPYSFSEEKDEIVKGMVKKYE